MAELSPNVKLSHYRIVSKIGAGGMGETYLAEDTHLRRKVALKILCPEIAANSDRMRRFKQEAQAAGRAESSEHCADFEIGEDQSMQYIT